MDTRITVKFLGGVADGQNLTGSCILLKIRQEKHVTQILIDTGLVQSGTLFFRKEQKSSRTIKSQNY